MEKNKKRTLILVIVIGIALCGLGIYLFFFETKGFLATTATIEQIEETFTGVDSDGHDEYRYDVTVSYSVGGKTLHGKVDTYSSSYKVGKQIRIFYNPENPEVIHGDSRLLGKIFIFVGPAVSALAAYALVKELRKKEENSTDSFRQNEE